MRESVPRATFIALRARREAYRIATDILYGHRVDVRAIECPACHSAIDPLPQASEVARCRACGQPVPRHLRLKPKRELTASEIEEVMEDKRLMAYAEEQAAREERRLVWFWSVVVAAVILALFFGIYVLNPRILHDNGF